MQALSRAGSTRLGGNASSLAADGRPVVREDTPALGSELHGTTPRHSLCLCAAEECLDTQDVRRLRQRGPMLPEVVQILQAKLPAHPGPEHLNGVQVGGPRRYGPEAHTPQCVGPHRRRVSQEGLVVTEGSPWPTPAARVQLPKGLRELPLAHRFRPLVIVSLLLSLTLSVSIECNTEQYP